MKIYRKKIFVLLLLGIVITTGHAQQTTNAVGGNASGRGGTASYSVGQVVYTTSTGTNGSEAQGVQQPFGLSSVGINETELNISLQAYPNPTSEYLQLKIESDKLQELSYQLFDINGKLIESKKITSTTETIRMENFPIACYFLKITHNNKEVNIFKIIKK